MGEETKDTSAKTEDTKDQPVMDVKPAVASKEVPVDDDWSDEPSPDAEKPKVDEPTTSPEVKINSDGQLSDQPKKLDLSSEASKVDDKAAVTDDKDMANSAATDNPMAIPPKPEKKKNNMIVVVVAGIIFVLLATAAYFAYKNNRKTTTSKAASKTTNSTTSSNKVTTSDVDQTNQDIDKSLNTTDDNKDFASSDLSDASLGL